MPQRRRLFRIAEERHRHHGKARRTTWADRIPRNSVIDDLLTPTGSGNRTRLQYAWMRMLDMSSGIEPATTERRLVSAWRLYYICRLCGVDAGPVHARHRGREAC